MAAFLFLVPLFFPTTAIPMNCSSYACNEDRVSMLPETCVYYNENRYYLQECGDGWYCPPINTPGNSTCLALGPSNAGSAYPGEPCTGNSTCLYGNCASGTCIANSTAMSCVLPTDCDAGLTCLPTSSGTYQCHLQKEVGLSCSSDTDCINTAGCYNNTVCKTYFELQEGDEVGVDCDASVGSYGWSYMCESVTCYDGFCLTALENNNTTLPVNCTAFGNNVCVNLHYADPATLDLKFHSECQCGYNPDSIAYCSLFPGDPPALQYWQKLQAWVNSTAINSCHTSRRFELPCIELYWDESDFQELQYLAYYYWFYPQIMGNVDNCAMAIYNSAYLQAQEAYMNYGFWLGLSLIAALSLA